jgi:hypothetical protein
MVGVFYAYKGARDNQIKKPETVLGQGFEGARELVTI